MTSPLSALSRETCRGLTGIFSDIDDTITHHGRIVPEAFQALHQAREAGLRTVLITGRPAGWVDHFARMWPVDGVVGENGGLWFWHDGERLQRRFLQPEEERAANQRKLAELARSIPARVPGCAVSVDQPYRELDLAIDFCEDVPPLGDDAIDAIVEAFEAAGATCKVSSIHVNGWFGSFDKLEGCRRFLAERWGEQLEAARERWAYFGDSANDEPMYAYFPHGVGVANIARFLPRMDHHPAYVTRGEGGHGFAEGVRHILANR
jgi:HAD superfamily hydrolase (TIGR01484 family)